MTQPLQVVRAHPLEGDRAGVSFETADGRTHGFLIDKEAAADAIRIMLSAVERLNDQSPSRVSLVASVSPNATAALLVRSPGNAMAQFHVDDKGLNELATQIRNHLRGRAAKR